MIDCHDIAIFFAKAVNLLIDKGFVSETRYEFAKRLFSRAELQISAENSGMMPACIIHPPVMKNGEIILDRITIILEQFSDVLFERYICYHELAHLLSIAPIIRISHNRYLRKWGVCETIYKRENDLFITSINNERYKQNEPMNECLACFLYTNIEKQPPYKHLLSRRGFFGERDQNEVIMAYLANQMPILR